MRPWPPQHADPQRYKVTHDGTSKTACQPREFAAGNDNTVIALWLGHEQVTTTQIHQSTPT
jgi:hypothetical protein